MFTILWGRCGQRRPIHLPRTSHPASADLLPWQTTRYTLSPVCHTAPLLHRTTYGNTTLRPEAGRGCFQHSSVMDSPAAQQLGRSFMSLVVLMDPTRSAPWRRGPFPLISGEPFHLRLRLRWMAQMRFTFCGTMDSTCNRMVHRFSVSQLLARQMSMKQ